MSVFCNVKILLAIVDIILHNYNNTHIVSALAISLQYQSILALQAYHGHSHGYNVTSVSRN